MQRGASSKTRLARHAISQAVEQPPCVYASPVLFGHASPISCVLAPFVWYAVAAGRTTPVPRVYGSAMSGRSTRRRRRAARPGFGPLGLSPVSASSVSGTLAPDLLTPAGCRRWECICPRLAAMARWLYASSMRAWIAARRLLSGVPFCSASFGGEDAEHVLHPVAPCPAVRPGARQPAFPASPRPSLCGPSASAVTAAIRIVSHCQALAGEIPAAPMSAGGQARN